MNVREHRRGRGNARTTGIVAFFFAVSAAAVLFFGAVRTYAQSDDRPTASASTLETISPPSSGDWERIDGSPTADAADDSAANQVLEIPQATDHNSAATQANNDGDPSVGTDQQDAQQEQADGSDNGDDGAAPDQVGSIQDYRSQQNEIGPAATFYPPIVARPLGMNPPAGISPPLGMSPSVGYSPPIPMLAPYYVPPMAAYPGEALPPGAYIVPPGAGRYHGYSGYNGGYGAYIPPGAPGAPMFIVPRSMLPHPMGVPRGAFRR